MRILSKIIRVFLDSAEEISLSAAAFLFAAMLVIGFVSVILRYIVALPLSWTEEILAFMMAWGVFLGGGTIVRRYSHIRMSFFAEKLFGTRRAPVVWTALENLVGLGATTFIAYHAYRWVLHTYRTGAHGIGDIPYPFWVVRLAVLIGLGLMGLFYLERTVKQIQTRGMAGTEEQQAMMSTGEILPDQVKAEDQMK
ncbi:TRAP transporter small permease [Chloroflexota bacterium]